MASEVSTAAPSEFNQLPCLRTMQFIATERPWLNLYGNRVRPVAPFGSASSKPFFDPALIHRSLPDELLFEVFARLSPYSLGRAACVCRKWRYATRDPSLWRNACLKSWQITGKETKNYIIYTKYAGSWRKMWMERPRIRTDGIYVSRNTYVHTGVADLRGTNPVQLVCYYRYLRFYPGGKFLYKICPQNVKEVVKCMNFKASKADCVYKGDYMLTDNQVETALLYPGFRYTVLRMRLGLRGTTLGANNRLDLLQLVTTGIDESEVRNCQDILAIMQGWETDETHDPDVPAVSHKRGLTPFVFVPFEEAATSVLNLPVESMDYFFTG